VRGACCDGRWQVAQVFADSVSEFADAASSDLIVAASASSCSVSRRVADQVAPCTGRWMLYLRASGEEG
jgi:hypothetical protein